MPDLIELSWDDVADRLAMALLMHDKLSRAIARKKLPGEADLDRKMLADKLVKDLRRGGVEKVLRREPAKAHSWPPAASRSGA
jgi:hypothetical protein